LSGEQIPLVARIFAVVDAFDAMTSDRPYRRACTAEWALNEIQGLAGAQFDPAVVEAFAAMLDEQSARQDRAA
jgi:HD-GYP domain-containing protein (c-di-GMP phosphodiesterase class II)